MSDKPYVFSLSVKVTGCNGELRSPEGRERALQWFRANHITKLWLESYRHGIRVPDEVLAEERDAFRAAGLTVCGMLTTTGFDGPLGSGARVEVCWARPEARERLREEVRRVARLFDTVIIDDFLYAGCDGTCPRCAAEMKRLGITDVGEFHRHQMYDVSENEILSVAREVNPKAQFIIKFPCWCDSWGNGGYDIARQPKLFGQCWVGTETRDACPDPLQACWIVDRAQKGSGGLCGGGWYDPLDCSPQKFVEQAYYTILGGAKESILHCYDYLVADDPGLGAFGESAARSHACAAAFTKEVEALQRLGDSLVGASFVSCRKIADGVSEHVLTKDGHELKFRFDHGVVTEA